MKILLDKNISFRAAKRLREVWPETHQVRELGLENKSDMEIWGFAKTHGYTILTFDSDFLDISNLHGSPPKIIWLRFGNRSTQELTEILILRSSIIESFVNTSSLEGYSCLEMEEPS